MTMRTFLCIILMGWMWLPFAARAQNPTITAAEYFLDADPGVGSGKSFPVPASANPSVQTQVSLQGLSLGFHTLSVRFKDNNEFWSVARTRVFLIESPVDSEEINTLAAVEFFINTDPGPGNGTKVNITPGAEASLAIPVSLSGLPEGFQNIGVRFQDQSGKWSAARSRIFFIQNPITDSPLLPLTAAEYFIDTDPGPGLGKSLSMSLGNNPQVVGNIATEGLETGFHTIGVRFKRQDNLWGLAKSRLFYVNDEDFDKPVMVDYLEYFFDDNDLGEGNATSISLTEPASAISVEALIAVADLQKGSHTISVRIRDNKGLWSLVETKDFIVGDPEFTTPPKPDLDELPNIEESCEVNLADLTAPTAKAEDGSTVIGTVDETLFPITKQGNTEITWTYTDSNGLKSTQKQVVIIEDNEAPSLTAPSKVVLNLGENQCSFSEVQLGEAVATDNCGEPVVSNNAPQVFGVGTTLVTWTATDAAGNQVQATQEVEVIDAIPPTILAPSNIFIQVPAGQDFAENVGLGQPVISDNCGIQSVTNDAPAVFELGMTIVTWTVTDVGGNIATAQQQLSVTQEALPTITAPAAISVNTDQGTCTASISDLGMPIVTGEAIPDNGISNDGPDQFPIGTTVVIWTVRDGKGNTATATQSVTVTDAELPTIIAPVAVTVLATLSRCDASDVALGQPTVADNCGIKSITNNAPELFPFGNTTVTWTAEDLNGNVATASQIVTVTEDQEPLITAPADLLVQIAPDADSATGVALGQAEASDNCGIDKIENDAPIVFPLGVTVVTWTVSDISGNTATAEQTVTVTREVLPTITAPPAITVNNDPGTCGASGIEVGTPSVTGEDIPADGITNTALETYPVGTTNVVWTVIDGRGNTATAIQTVTVVDNEAPSIIAPPTVNTLTVANGCESGEIDLGEPEVSDNCEIAEVSNNAPEVFPLGTSTVIWTVIDVNGNEATAEQTVIVVDEELPLITAPANITIRIEADEDSAGDVELGQPTVSDNCSIDEVSNNAPGSFPVGTTTVTWTVRDESGNEATAEQTVTVTREVLPTIAAPSDITISADAGTCAAAGIDLGTPSVTGEDIPSDGISNDAPSIFPIGTTIVIWTVTDGNGNTATAEQTVTVEDRENPVIAAVTEIIRSNDSGTCEADIEITAPAVSDNCDSPIATGTRSDGFALDAPYPVGNTQITWTATDASGNEAEEVVQTVTVEDTEAPQITAPANINIQIGESEDSATDVELGTPTTSDNCGVEDVGNDAPASFPRGTTIVIWTVTDVNGNSATAQQSVTVSREVLPTIMAPADITVGADEGICEATEVTLGTPEVTGEDIPADGISNNAPASFPVGTTIVIWTVTDGNGNTATASQTVTVEYNEAPQITAPANISIQLQAGEESATDVELGTPTTSDNCGVEGVSNDAPTFFPTGTTIVIWTVTDVNGNTATDTQTVTVLPADSETDLPTVTAPADILVDTDKGICEANNVDLGIATFTGDIPDGGLTNDAPAFFPLGETIVIWTVTDRNGNKATSVQKVSVRDREIPEIKAPANLVLGSTGGGIPASEIDLGEPEVSDNCNIAEVRNNAPAIFPIGTTTVAWTVIDGSGNECTAKQRVTVNLTDNCEVTAKAKPVVTLKLNSQGKARLNPDMADDGSTASCGTLKLDLSKCDFTCEDIGENTVKLIAKDGKGNRDVAEFKVIVVDEIKPKIKVEKKAFVWMMRKGDTFTMPDFRDRVEASDNCGFELHQCPEPGTKFRKPENSFVEFEAKDASGNKAKDKFKFNLLVFKCKVPNKNGRTTGEQELSDVLFVPWNTAFDKAISEGIVFEEGSDPEFVNSINWQMNDYDPLSPGLYRITASIENEGFEGWNSTVDIPVIVQDKPLAEDIMISRNKVSSKVQSGEIIGSLNTLDPVDNIHTYSMEEHSDFYIEKNVLVWRGYGTPDAEMTVTVHSTDRAGQTISREITLYKELARGEILIYPNPAKQETNILVQLSGAGTVGIRIFDAAGRLVYQEQAHQEGSFVRNLNLRGLSSGMYQVIVQSGNEVMTGRLVKEE